MLRYMSLTELAPRLLLLAFIGRYLPKCLPFLFSSLNSQEALFISSATGGLLVGWLVVIPAMRKVFTERVRLTSLDITVVALVPGLSVMIGAFSNGRYSLHDLIVGYMICIMFSSSSRLQVLMWK